MKLKEAKTLTKIGELKGWVETSKAVIATQRSVDPISADYALDLLLSKLNNIDTIVDELKELNKPLVLR